jgi:hypothetical protein
MLQARPSQIRQQWSKKGSFRGVAPSIKLCKTFDLKAVLIMGKNYMLSRVQNSFAKSKGRVGSIDPLILTNPHI